MSSASDKWKARQDTAALVEQVKQNDGQCAMTLPSHPPKQPGEAADKMPRQRGGSGYISAASDAGEVSAGADDTESEGKEDTHGMETRRKKKRREQQFKR
ncbi:hypothetical protein PHYPSEUDO_015540 [Phytophthora pseudosyringae]|uniref:Uncharacterized protein n=1 Tax=Phytophthora pseudosyringae TaxID=221518 RepID=A0A8T1W2U6_9STRA|nr:hypothetical protein PHYPSEUDO_015540 [Phytophthora pseudosyringae]